MPLQRAQHRYQIKKLYGLTMGDYDKMLVEQHGRCAICGEPMRKPFIDHDHLTGAVRGLLCNVCNLMLGYLENPVKRAAAERYLAERGR